MAATIETAKSSSSQPKPVEYTSWPLRDEGLKALIMLGALAGIAAVVFAFVSWGAALTVGGLCCLAAWRFFVPTRIEIKETGIFQTVLGRRRRTAWETIGHCDVCRHGILLTPDRRHTGPLEALRGIYIAWGTRQEEVVRTVLFYFERARRHSNEVVRAAGKHVK